MNQLDFGGARDHLDEQMVQPEFAVIAATGRRLRVRGRTKLVTAVAATVAAILAAISAVQFGAAPATGLLGADQWCRTLPVSAQVSYLVLGGCQDGQGMVLARTSDNGRSWEAHRLPNLQTAPPPYGAAVALDEDTVVVMGFVTHDGGRSWQPVDRKLDTPIETVPAGWAVALADSYLPNTHDQRLAAIDPVSGRLHPLAHQPAALGDGGVTEARDGSLWTAPGWVSGGVAVSRDRGRTWRNFAPAEKNIGWSSSASLDGRVGYAVFSGRDGGRTVIYRTDDGGVNWRPWSTPAVKSLGSVHLLANGDLIGLSLTNGISGSPMMRSTDQGRTFTSRFPTQLFFWLDRTPSGGLTSGTIQGHGEPVDFQGAPFFTGVSADGLEFAPLALPPGTSAYLESPQEVEGSARPLPSMLVPSTTPSGSPSPGR